MNLSKFYKDSNEFKPGVLLERSLQNISPMWESIVNPAGIAEDTSNVEQRDTTLPTDPESEEKFTAAAAQPELETVADMEPLAEEIQEDLPAEPSFSEPPTREEIIPQPAVDIEEIRENAFNSGISVGRKQAEEDFENGAQTLLCICNELDGLRETVLKNSISEMRELVLAIAEKIIRHSVEEQSETITATIKEAIQLAVKSDEFQIQLNPQDLACVEKRKNEIVEQISGLDSIFLKADATLERGGCTIESSCCTVDASMASQLKVIRDSVMTSEQLSGNNGN